VVEGVPPCDDRRWACSDVIDAARIVLADPVSVNELLRGEERGNEKCDYLTTTFGDDPLSRLTGK